MLVARVCFAIAPSARHSVSLRASLAPNRHRRARSTSLSPRPSASHGSSFSSTCCPSLFPSLPQRGPKVQRPCDHRTAAREHGPGFDARWEETWVSPIVVQPIRRKAAPSRAEHALSAVARDGTGERERGGGRGILFDRIDFRFRFSNVVWDFGSRWLWISISLGWWFILGERSESLNSSSGCLDKLWSGLVG